MLETIPESWAVGRKTPLMNCQSITGLTLTYTFTGTFTSEIAQFPTIIVGEKQYVNNIHKTRRKVDSECEFDGHFTMKDL